MASNEERVRALELAHETVEKAIGFAVFCQQESAKKSTELSPEELEPLLEKYGKMIAKLRWAMLTGEVPENPPRGSGDLV